MTILFDIIILCSVWRQSIFYFVSERRIFMEQAMAELTAPNEPILGLNGIVNNMKKMDDYYEIVGRQVRHSYQFALLSSCVGIVAFIFASLFVVVGHADISSVIIPAAGGAITEIIAGTFLFIYKKSLEQMNYYFDSLLRKEKFLYAVNLVGEISDVKKDEIYNEIIESWLDVTSSKNKVGKNP